MITNTMVEQPLTVAVVGFIVIMILDYFNYWRIKKKNKHIQMQGQQTEMI